MYAKYKLIVESATSSKSEKSPKQTEEDKKEPTKDDETEQKEDMSKLRTKFPHLSNLFNNMDKFAESLKENPMMDDTFENTFTMLQLELMFVGENDRFAVGDYFSLTGAAAAIKTSYATLMESLGVPCMAAITPDIKEKNGQSVLKMEGLRGIIALTAYTPFGEKLANDGVLAMFVEDLKFLKVEDLMDEQSERFKFFDTVVSNIHNYLTNPAVRQPLRDCDSVNVLLPFLKCQSRGKLLTVCTLAKLVDETENEHLLADDTIFDVLFEYLNTALKNSSHIAHGWALRGLVKGMWGLAKNDSNKSVLYEKGAVPILIQVIKTGNDVEKERSLGCIWELAFDKTIKEALAQNEELINLLKELETSPKEAVSKAAKGALWEIQQEERAQFQGGSETVGGHVMISYQWADQKMLLKIKDSLNENGYKVWMDVVNMSESTLEAMAKAVEDAAVVLVCMSERYKLSQNCRSEAEYAFSLKKKIVPLIMQRNYIPDGWLGMIKGTKLFFDFSGKYQYNDKLEDLLRELGQFGKQQLLLQSMDGSELPSMSLTQTWKLETTRSKTVASWSKKDVHKWLTKIGLQDKSALQQLSGENLVFLQDLSHRAPEYYCNYVENKLGLTSLNEMMAFGRAIDKL